MKAVVAAFNQEKALVGVFSVITNLRMELFEALPWSCETGDWRVVCDNIWYLEGGVGAVSTVDTYVGHGVGRGVRVQQQVDDLRVSLLRCLQSVTC